MRVALVAPTPFGPGADGLLGGGERYPLELARALAPLVESELITFGRRPALRREPGGLWVRTLPWLARLWGHPAHPVAPGLPAALTSATIVHVHQMRSTPSRIAALVGRVRDQPVVVTDHGLQGSDWAGFLPRLFRRFLTVSAYSARELNAPPARTRVIFGGADPARFHPDDEQRRQGVLFVGRLTPHKGVDRLVRALPRGQSLTIAGSTGHDRALPERGYPDLLHALAADRHVRFLGAVPDAELPRLYRSAQVLALPSVERTCYGRTIRVSELLGLVMLEAMASGTPVVCSRLGGLTEVVEHGVTGFVVEPGNVAELHDRLRQLLADPALAARFGRAARERALARFTWRRCAERCLKAYDEVASVSSPQNRTERLVADGRASW